MNSQRKKFKKLLKKDKIIAAPGAFDVLSARIIEQAGFPAVYLTGGGLSRTWGFPDLGLMTLTENMAFISRVCDSIEIPVIADADTGYGNALNVYRTVREYERTGVAGFHLEDQITPKRCGHYEGKEIVSKKEMIGKINAAVDARIDQNLVIIARTDARAIRGIDEAIERSNTFIEAGADVAFVEAPRSEKELERISNEIHAPVMVNMIKGSKTPLLSLQELEKMGFKIAIYPNEPHRAAIWAIREVVKILKETGSTDNFKLMVDFETREEIVGTKKWIDMEKKYL